MSSPVDFFNLDAPCPNDIPDCEALRENYKKELNDLQSIPGCSGCKINALKSKYMNIIVNK